MDKKANSFLKKYKEWPLALSVIKIYFKPIIIITVTDCFLKSINDEIKKVKNTFILLDQCIAVRFMWWPPWKACTLWTQISTCRSSD